MAEIVGVEEGQAEIRRGFDDGLCMAQVDEIDQLSVRRASCITVQ
jgi:hypothetical protein